MEAFLIGPDLVPRGRLPWISTKISPKLNASGGLTMQVPGESTMANRITEGCRVRIADGDTEPISAFITTIERSTTSKGVLNLNLSGILELGTLAWRITYPDPTRPEDSQKAAYYTDTGAAGDVITSLLLRNIGPAALAARRGPGVVIDSAAGLGKKVSVKTRFDSLLEQAGTLADQGGLALHACYGTDRKIHIGARAVTDRSRSLVLRQDRGTLGEWRASITAPEATTFIVGGQGEGADRMIRSYALAATDTWGVRVESFKDQRDAKDATELATAGQKLVDETTGSGAVTLTLNETIRALGRDFHLGDTLSADLGGVVFTDTLQAADIEWSDTGRKVTLTLGSGEDRDNKAPAWVRRVRKLNAALRNLEVR